MVVGRLLRRLPTTRHAILEAFRSGEFRHLRCGNPNGLAGARVACGARFPLAPAEGAQTRDRDLFSPRDCSNNRLHNGVDRAFCIRPGASEHIADALDNVLLVHSAAY